MEYTTIPRTELIASRIGFGCEPLGGTDWGATDEKSAIKAVSRALELGVNVFDTANVYGLGRSEELLAQALGHRRHNVIIITKGGVNWRAPHPGEPRAKTFLDSSPAHIVEAIEGSLRRLKIDTIPIYLVHWPDPNTPIEDTLEALLTCQQEGKIRYFGVSNFPLRLLHTVKEIAMPIAVETQYNLIQRSAEETILPFCHSYQVGVFGYGPLAQGLLTGKYHAHSHFTKDDRRHRLPHFQPDQLPEHLVLVERLKEVAAYYHKTPAQTALRWVLDNPAITSVIVGAKSPAQIEANVRATIWQLTPAERRYIETGMLAEATMPVSV